MPGDLALALLAGCARKLLVELRRSRDERGRVALSEPFVRERLAWMSRALEMQLTPPATRLYLYALRGLAVHFDTLREYDRANLGR